MRLEVAFLDITERSRFEYIFAPDEIRTTGETHRLGLCSGDPICADHDPTKASEDRALHGAACHGCLLIAETSCEQRNVYLDRSLLVGTIASSAAYFSPGE